MNGVVTSILNQAEGLSRRGNDILIIAPMMSNQEKYGIGKHNIETMYIKSKKAFFYPEFRISNPFSGKIIKKIKQFKPDIIHFHTQFTLGLSSIIIAKRLNIPLVGTFHTFISDPKYLKHVYLHSWSKAEKIAWKYSNFFYRRSDVVVCPSRNAANELRNAGIKNKITIIPNSIKLKEIANHKNKKIKLINKKNFNLVYVGRISHEKNVNILLESLKRALSKNSNITLTLIGKGPSLKKLKLLSKRLGISKNVAFLGQIDNEVLLKDGLLSYFDTFITASTTENQPMSMLEAMANGLPIIGVNERGVPELVTHMKNGLLVVKDSPEAFAKSILHLTQNKALQQKLGRESKRRAKHYDYMGITKDLEHLYDTLIKKRVYHK